MERVKTTPRANWQKLVEGQGLHYHTNPDGNPYWDESAYYHLESWEAEALEECTYWLNQFCLEAVEQLIQDDRLEEVGVPADQVEYVKHSWDVDEHTLYGRFDLRFDGKDPKLLEYNADTPTGLLEASVVQWHWMKDCHDGYDQFNSLHERLIEVFKTLASEHTGTFYFVSQAESLEDFMTANYLRDCAIQAGWKTEYLAVEDLGWHEGRQQFTDLNENTIRHCFKLYPWEWMLTEQFGDNLRAGTVKWYEPPWKTVLSNKAILAILWEMYPNSPYLLPAFLTEPAGKSVRKPVHAREGANITVGENGREVLATQGPYEGPYVWQEYCELPCFDGNYPVIGSWLVNGYSAGIGIREDTSPITTNTSRFIPHICSK